MLTIDGSYGEGGGQIVRTALVLSLLTGRPIRVVNIRKGRKKPGLKTQHLFILRALRQITDSHIQGDRLGSLEIEFTPGPIRGGTVYVDFQTAGSIPLFLQTLLPVSLFADQPVHLRIRGGTDVPMSMTWDYFVHVLVPYFRPLVQRLEVRCRRRGYYPPGGGDVEIRVMPRFRRSLFPDFQTFLATIRSELGALDLQKKGPTLRLDVWITVSRALQDRQVYERIRKGFEKSWHQKQWSVTYQGGYEDSRSPGCTAVAVADFGTHRAGVDLLCRKGVPAERVGQKLATEFRDFLQSPDAVDSHLQDNLVLLLALRGGRVRMTHLTSHTQTHLWLVQKFLGAIFHREGDILKVEPT